MSGPRGTSNSNTRGSASQRRARRQALLDRDGDGVKAPCWECGTLVDFVTLICDRIVPGIRGGRYVMENLRVHCDPCSHRQACALSAETRRWNGLAKRGLRRTRLSPGGERHLDRWWIVLDGRPVGHVAQAGKRWLATLLVDGAPRSVEPADSQRQAIACLANLYDGRPRLIRMD